MVEIGTQIKELREAKKMSQKDLAQVLNVTPQAVSKWELNKSYPDLDTLVQLSQYFGVTTDKLLGNAKQSFFEALFSKKEGRDNMELSEKSVQVTKLKPGEIPKVVKAEMVSTFFKLEFDNGAVKYLKSHYNEDLVDFFSPKSEKKKRAAMLFLMSKNVWVGSELVIEGDGTVVLNGNDRYSPEELWNNSQEHIIDL